MLNQAQLIGHVGQDPEIRSTSTGDRVASFTLATSERWTNKAGVKEEKTEWHRVTVWNQALIKIVEQYVRKGQKLYVCGTLRTDKYDKDGQTHYATKVVLGAFNSQLTMLDKAPEREGTAA